MSTPIDRESVERLRRKMVGSSCFPDLLFPKADVKAVLDECDTLRAALDAAEAENEMKRVAMQDAATFLNGSLDPTMRESDLRKTMAEVRDNLRAALQENPDG